MCAVIVQALARVPYLVYCRGSDVYGEWLFKKQVGRLVMSQAGAVVALTEHMRRQMRSLCDKDVVVIPNGVDFARFRGLPYKREARRRLNLFPECPTLLYVGKLVRVKGVRFLVEAMDAVRHEVPSCQLVIVGAGTELQALERLVERLHLRENVRFVGEVSNDEVPLLMAAADVFVLPSLSEGFPNVLLEAMAAGLPVVATNVGGIPELVEEGENGFLVQPEDAAGLERRLRDMLADSTLARSIGEANSRKSLGYKWEDVAAQLEGLYRQVVDASRDVADRAPDSLGR